MRGLPKGVFLEKNQVPTVASTQPEQAGSCAHAVNSGPCQPSETSNKNVFWLPRSSRWTREVTLGPGRSRLGSRSRLATRGPVGSSGSWAWGQGGGWGWDPQGCFWRPRKAMNLLHCSSPQCSEPGHRGPAEPSTTRAVGALAQQLGPGQPPPASPQCIGFPHGAPPAAAPQSPGAAFRLPVAYRGFVTGTMA